MISKAVVLARGLGTRMRASNEKAKLNPDQTKIAESGVKTLIPIDGKRTFLDFIIENLRKAGFSEICLVIGEEHQILKDFCRQNNLQFAIQKDPLGTSDAVFSAREFVGNDKFLVVNSDNLYPLKLLKKLQKFETGGLVVFEKESLIRESNISEEKIKKFAIVEFDDEFKLTNIVEKPENIGDGEIFVSMNAWIFTPKIFTACRKIKPSERNELELSSAVQFAIDELGETFKVEKYYGGVLDLSSREDIASVIKKLSENEAN